MLSKQLRSVIHIARRNKSSINKSGIWSDFTNRPKTLRIKDQKFEKDLFEGIDPTVGPASLESQPARRLAYYSPVIIDETFKIAYDLLQEESSKIYDKIEKLKSENGDPKLIDKLSILAEQYNPEVLFNIEHCPDLIDKSHPVYRRYLEEIWESHDKMLIMQRLEQLHVIPDTLPTLQPKVDVKVKFPHNKRVEFADWVDPGTVLPAFAVAKPPTIKIQEFESLSPNQLYTVVLVNPDSPDLELNSFKTELNYGLCNVTLDYNDCFIDTAKLLKQGDEITFKEYVPLVPERNIGNQRACLWVFRQNSSLSTEKLSQLSSENFDIRSFTQDNDLTPVGAFVWRQAFDRSVENIRKEFNLPPGRVFDRNRSEKILGPISLLPKCDLEKHFLNELNPNPKSFKKKEAQFVAELVEMGLSEKS